MRTFVPPSSPPPIAPLPLFYVVLSVSHQPSVVLSEKGEQEIISMRMQGRVAAGILNTGGF